MAVMDCFLRIKPLLSAVLFILLCGAVVPAQAAFAQTSNRASDINIQADQQIFDAATSRTTFKGKVNVRYKDMRINGSQAVVDMSPTGEPQVANFLNRPKAKKITPGGKEDVLDADIIRIYLTSNAMRAEGNVISYVTSVAADPFTIRSDVQQYDSNTKNVAASGGVVVNYQKTVANSPHALLTTGPDGKADKITFLGGARLRNADGDVNAEKITLTVANNNMVAEKNVVTNSLVKSEDGSPSKVRILSDFQQYDKASGTMLASGNAIIYYQNYVARGPKATFKLKNSQVDKITFTGRASITEDARTVTADTIVITMKPKRFDAYGNVKTRFVANSAGPAAAGGKPDAKAGVGKPKPGVKPLVEVGED